jgi:hypothetical protein
VSACIANAGDSKATKDWMASHHVPQLNAQGAAIFLRNSSGVGYDASNSTGRYALTVLDNGLCTVFAEHAKDSDVIELLKASQTGLVQQKDYPDPNKAGLHHYDFVLNRGGVDYNVVISTAAAPANIQAFLSIARRTAN